MTGIMPTGGIGPANAINAVQDPLLAAGCTPLFHAPRCNPRFDTASANAIISEILNLLKCQNYPYDCTKLDNLCEALKTHEISGRQTFDFDDTNTPIAVLNGNNRNMGGGTFTVPNTFRNPINVFMAFESTIQFNQVGGGASSSLDMNIQVNTASDFSGQTLADLIYRVRSFDVGAGTAQFASNPTSYRAGINIPPGGRNFYWRALTTTSGGGNWELQYTEHALSVTVHGINTDTRDPF